MNMIGVIGYDGKTINDLSVIRIGQTSNQRSKQHETSTNNSYNNNSRNSQYQSFNSSNDDYQTNLSQIVEKYSLDYLVESKRLVFT